MLAAKDAIPPVRLFKYRARNPTVELPEGALDLMETATHGLITHFQKGHFDHLDRAGARWLRGRYLPILCTQKDADVLSKKGLQTLPLKRVFGED